MTVSISWLLEQRHLGLTLLTRAGAARGEIHFVQPTELNNPQPWLSGGELVLTTGLALTGKKDQWQDYAQRLHSAGIAALAFGTGLSHNAVPAVLVDAAQAVGLPVLHVPFSTPFAAVTKAVMSRLAQQEYEQVMNAAQVQTRITRAALRHGVTAILRELSGATGGPVAYVGRTSALVHPASAGEMVEQVRSVLERDSNASSRASITVSEPGRTLTLHRVGLGDRAFGYLAVSSSESLGTIEQVLLGHAASLLTLDLEKPLRLRADRTDLNAVALGLMLDGLTSAETIHRYLAEAGDESGCIRFAVIECSDTNNVVQHLDTLMSDNGRSLFADVESTTVSVLLYGSDSADIMADVIGRLPKPEQRTFRVGLSRPHPLLEFATAREQARIALGGASYRDQVVDFEAFNGSTILGSTSTREVLMAMASSGLEVLARHDREHGTTLIDSLRSYLESHGQWESAAAELGIHRHTLRGRIRRCEELLGNDFDKARVRAELLLALTVWTGRTSSHGRNG